MKIYTNKDIGFCKGVKNAVDTANKYAGENVYTYGEIVHNDFVINDLKKKGIKIVRDINELKQGDTLIIRAHGCRKDIFNQCEAKGVKVIDATCPFVKVMAKRAEEYYLKGYQIVLIGQREHPEIVGVNGWCNDTAIITNGDEKCDLNSFQKVMIMYQTTFPFEKADSALENLKKDNVKSLEVFHTICYTTKVRQLYAEHISKICDMNIVVGGKNSSNTQKLFNICLANCTKSIHIEDVREIATFDFTKYNNISIIAGASTPQELIEEVLSKMFADAKNNDLDLVEVNEFTKAVDKMPDKKKPLRKGQKLRGMITHISDEGIMVNIGSKKEGLIPNDLITLGDDFDVIKNGLKVGDTIEVVVVSSDKTLVLSRKAIEEINKADEVVEDIKKGVEFTVVASKSVKGGLLSKIGSYTVFIPASHIKSSYVKTPEQYVGKKLRLVALENGVDDVKKKIVASQRQLIVNEKKVKEDNFWTNIEVGEIVEGKVLRFASFGAFVSVRGFDCLAHLSDLSWNNIKEPSEVLELNKTYEFVVLKLDRAANRVSIGYKQLQPHPWQLALENHPVGSVCQGKVARILPYGAFVEIEPGIDGLLHISNVSWEWIGDINKVIKVGDMIDIAILEFDIENKRITISRKATMPQPENYTTQPETTD